MTTVQIEIDNGDVALVLKQDGRLFLHIPKQPENDEPTAYNVVLGTAIARALVRDSPVFKTMVDELADEVGKLNTSAKVLM